MSSQLKKTEYLTLAIVVGLLQIHKQVSIKRLATVWSYPILFESRRRNLQRFFKLPVLRIETLWFPLVKYILNTAFKNQSVLMLAIDRTQLGVKFVLRVKQERYIQSEKEEYQRLSELELIPGTGFYKSGVKVTKQKGFGCFDVAGYWKRKYRNNGTSEGWYLLTNVGSLKLAIASFKCRSGIEAMFKDCKTGGYNERK